MDVETLLGHRFTRKALLKEALTHPGCAESHKGAPFNYQRLEFLGDAVLGMAVAEMLYRLYPGENEGSLAKRHAALVCSESVSSLARELGIGPHIRMSPGEQDSARDSNSYLEDVCEALIGALYLDGGYEAAQRFILSHWQPLARKVATPPKDAKTSLQEWAQGKGLKLPTYRLLETTGPAHAPEFTIAVSLETGQSASAKAMSKRQGEQLAAAALMEQLDKE